MRKTLWYYFILSKGNLSAYARKSFWLIWRNGIQYQRAKVGNQKGKSVQKTGRTFASKTEKSLYPSLKWAIWSKRVEHLVMGITCEVGKGAGTEYGWFLQFCREVKSRCSLDPKGPEKIWIPKFICMKILFSI